MTTYCPKCRTAMFYVDALGTNVRCERCGREGLASDQCLLEDLPEPKPEARMVRCAHGRTVGWKAARQVLGLELAVVLLVTTACSGGGRRAVPIPAPPPLLAPLIGDNFNSTLGNAAIPAAYVAGGDWTALQRALAALPPNVSVLRTLIWPTRPIEVTDATDKAWVHAPLTSSELDAIADYVHHTGRKVELAVGPLWQMLDNNDELPRELWLAPTVIAERLLALVKQLPTDIWQLDAYNEFMLTGSPGQEEVMRLYWPAVRQWARERGVRLTASVILDPTERPADRALATLEWLREHGGLPDVVEVHINGWTSAGIVERLPPAIAALRAATGLEVGVGESDVVLDEVASRVIAGLNFKYWIRWRK